MTGTNTLKFVMRGSSPRMTINDCFSTARHSLGTRIRAEPDSRGSSPGMTTKVVDLG
jgi:hypothetical protein